MTTPPPLSEFLDALHKSWDSETGYQNENWSTDNPARGQCVTSSLVFQDYYGGDLVRFSVTGENIKGYEYHYCNLLDDGTLIDTTRSQYQIPVNMVPKPVDLKGFDTIREKRLTDDETRGRYTLLKQRVSEQLSF